MLPCLRVTNNRQLTTDNSRQWRGSILRNHAFLALVGGAAVLLAASAVYIAVSTPSLPEKIIMHFDGDQGITRFGAPQDLWWAWGMAAAGIVIDVSLAGFLFHRDRVLSYILAAAAPVVGLLLFIAVGTIISVN
ncbi:MAG: hypothetical protein Q7S84_01940 [bacterium]|nr:hypothetical protein [bacterium]